MDHISGKVLTQYESYELMFDYGWRCSCFQLLSYFHMNFVRGRNNSGLRMVSYEVTYVRSRISLCLTSQGDGFARNDNKRIWSFTGDYWRNYINNNVFLRSTSLNDPSFSYRSGKVNSNTVNSKFHLIQSLFEIFARFLSFHV